MGVSSDINDDNVHYDEYYSLSNASYDSGVSPMGANSGSLPGYY